MIRKRGIREKMIYAYNPLPNVTEKELIERAKLPLMEPSVLNPFAISWKYGGGLEAEEIQLQPGDMIPLRASEGAEILRDLSELGLVLVEDAGDDEEVAKARLTGLRKALAYWRERGAPRIARYRRERNITKEDVEEIRYDLHPWHLGQAKADVITETIEAAVKVRLTPAPKAAAR